MEGLDLLIKLGTLSGILFAAQLWVVRRIERGQQELKTHHSRDNARLADDINRTLKRITKKLKKKVSKRECKQYRANLSRCPQTSEKLEQSR